MLVDASSLIYRAYYSTPNSISTPKGVAVNAAHGFFGMLARLVTDHEPEFLACATDEDWRPQWRVDLIPSYKTHRIEGERAEAAQVAEDEIGPQTPIIAELLGLFGVAVVGAPDFEAEDIIGALAEGRKNVAIVSGDRDLFQLVRDPDVRVLYPRRGVSELSVVDESYITAKYGIPGRAYGDYAVLRGDPSDGLPGVRGIGEKTASRLVKRHGSLEAVIEAAMTEPVGALGKVAASLDYLDKAAQVSLISPKVPIGDPDITLPHGGFDKTLEATAENYGLLGPVRRLEAALTGSVLDED